MGKSIYTFHWTADKTKKIIRFCDEFFSLLQTTHEAAVRSIISLILNWLNRNAPLGAQKAYMIDYDQLAILDNLGKASYKQMSPEAYQATQWIFQAIDKGTTPDFWHLRETLDKVFKHLAELK